MRLDWYERKNRIDLADYVQSATWDIMACPGHLHMEFDRAEMQNKSYAVYTLKIRRKPLYYTTNLIIPCVMISLLSVCVFFLPPDALEKMTLCISILLAMTFFLLLISKILPPTSLTVSLIAKYLLFTFMMNLIAIFCTVTIINWNFRISKNHPMSIWVRLVMLNFLPRIIFMKRPDHEKKFGRVGEGGSEGKGMGKNDVLLNKFEKGGNIKKGAEDGKNSVENCVDEKLKRKNAIKKINLKKEKIIRLQALLSKKTIHSNKIINGLSKGMKKEKINGSVPNKISSNLSYLEKYKHLINTTEKTKTNNNTQNTSDPSKVKTKKIKSNKVILPPIAVCKVSCCLFRLHFMFC